MNADGSLDEPFNTASGFNAALADIRQQHNDKIVVVEAFTSFNGAPARYNLRLNADGTRDTTLNTGLGPKSSIGALATAPDQRIYTAGNFNLFNGVQRIRIARLSSNGQLDVDFDPQAGFDGLVYALAVQPDGKLLAGGNFLNYNNTPVGRFVRILTSGQPDVNFNPGSGGQKINQSINTISIGEDGKILLAGLFSSFSNLPCPNMVRAGWLPQNNPTRHRRVIFNYGLRFLK